VIRIGVAVERHAGGGQTVRALSCLPALVGTWRKPGGGILQLPLWAFPVNWGAMMRPDMLTPGKRVINQYLLGEALTGEMPLDPPLKALMVYNSNPVVVCPDQDKLVRGLSQDDLFTVVSEQFLTDTAAFADIVLPTTTQLEQKDIMFSWGHLYVSYNHPSIEPLGEAVPNTELFRRLAARMGFTDPVFRRTDDEMIAESFHWSAPAMRGITVESLKEKGWQRLNVPPPDAYAPHTEGGFPTLPGRANACRPSRTAVGAPRARTGGRWSPPTRSSNGCRGITCSRPCRRLAARHPRRNGSSTAGRRRSVSSPP
jgi:anaerobic selenocysteine-containing dehydrogenase